MKLSIAHKLTGGFGIMIALFVVVATVVYSQANTLTAKTNEAVDEYVPAVEHGLTLQSAIHHSLSMHRGYMILGLDALAQERLNAWAIIDEETAFMDKLSADWTDPALKSDWESAKKTMAKLRTAQDQIAAVAHTVDDLPANEIFYHEADTYAKKMVVNLEKILELEMGKDATHERKELVHRVSAAESHLLKAEYAIAAFLNSGDGKDLDRVDSCVSSCQASVDKLMTMTHLFDPAQQSHFNQYIDARKTFLELATQAVTIRSEPGYCVSEDICLNQVAPLSGEADTLLAGVIANRSKAEKKAVDEIHSASASMTSIVLISTVAAVLIGAGIAFFLSKQILGALGKIMGFTNAMADRNLRVEPLNVKTGDDLQELAESMNRMQEALRQVIAEVSRASNEVAGASTQISASNDEIAGGMADQARQVEQISAAIAEMSASARQVAERSSSASHNAENSTKLASEGGDVVEETITGMNSINDAVSGSATSVSELGKRSEQIGQIIDVINDIADQTNLLALNAAIEAARAGEHGRGFAVVADEVRKLAERTQEATEEVSGSVRAIQEETTIAVDKMRCGTEEVAKGVQLASTAGQSLGSIFTGTQEVTEMIREIASAAEEQAATADDVSRNITEIGNASQATTRSTREASAASTQLSSKAEELRALVEQFSL